MLSSVYYPDMLFLGLFIAAIPKLIFSKPKVIYFMVGYGWSSVSGLPFGPALQMKGLWENPNINVWFPFMYSQIYYFQNTIIVFCLPVPTLIYLVWDLYISRIGLPILLQENMWTDAGNI